MNKTKRYSIDTSIINSYGDTQDRSHISPLSTTNAIPIQMLSTPLHASQIPRPLFSPTSSTPMHASQSPLSPQNNGQQHQYQQSEWQEGFDVKYQRKYYYNRRTRRSTWTKPQLENLVENLNISTSNNTTTTNTNTTPTPTATTTATATTTILGESPAAVFLRKTHSASSMKSESTIEDEDRSSSTSTVDDNDNINKAARFFGEPHQLQHDQRSIARSAASSISYATPMVSPRAYSMSMSENKLPSLSSSSFLKQQQQSRDRFNSEIKGSDWIEIYSKEHGRNYYYNPATMQSVWSDPRRPSTPFSESRSQTPQSKIIPSPNANVEYRGPAISEVYYSPALGTKPHSYSIDVTAGTPPPPPPPSQQQQQTGNQLHPRKSNLVGIAAVMGNQGKITNATSINNKNEEDDPVIHSTLKQVEDIRNQILKEKEEQDKKFERIWNDLHKKANEITSTSTASNGLQPPRFLGATTPIVASLISQSNSASSSTAIPSASPVNNQTKGSVSPKKVQVAKRNETFQEGSTPLVPTKKEKKDSMSDSTDHDASTINEQSDDPENEAEPVFRGRTRTESKSGTLGRARGLSLGEDLATLAYGLQQHGEAAKLIATDEKTKTDASDIEQQANELMETARLLCNNDDDDGDDDGEGKNDVIEMLKSAKKMRASTALMIFGDGSALPTSEQVQSTMNSVKSTLRYVKEEIKAQKEATMKAREIELTQGGYYALLDVPIDATDDELKKSFRKMMIKWHPDKVKAELRSKALEMSNNIHEAYNCLSNKWEREIYDWFGLEQYLIHLKVISCFKNCLYNGIEIIKHPRQGFPRRRTLWLDHDLTHIHVYQHRVLEIPDNLRKRIKSIKIEDIIEIRRGLQTSVFERTGSAKKWNRYFSIMTTERSLDLEATTPEIADFLVTRLSLLIIDLQKNMKWMKRYYDQKSRTKSLNNKPAKPGAPKSPAAPPEKAKFTGEFEKL